MFGGQLNGGSAFGASSVFSSAVAPPSSASVFGSVQSSFTGVSTSTSNTPTSAFAINNANIAPEETWEKDTTFEDKTPLQEASKDTTSTVFVRNIPTKFLNKQDILQYFGKVGQIDSVEIKGPNALVTFHARSSAISAMGMLKNTKMSATWARLKHETATHSEHFDEIATNESTFLSTEDKGAGSSSEETRMRNNLLDKMQKKHKDADTLHNLSKTKFGSTFTDEKQRERLARFAPFDLSAKEQEVKAPARNELGSHQQPALQNVATGEEKDTLVGRCMTMCPEKEVHERAVAKDIAIFEMDPSGDSHGVSAAKYAIKKYKKNAVLLDATATDPYEVRPPSVLKHTMDFMVDNVLDRNDVPYHEVYNFMRDRTRSIRQDFTYQHLNDELCVEIHEQITRFHILAEHILCEEDEVNFNEFQNMEQLSNCLTSLRMFYDDLRFDNVPCPNEAEFRAYFILTNLGQEGDIVTHLYSLNMAPEVYFSKEVQFALKVFYAFRERRYVHFFRLARQATYLQACLILRKFNEMRVRALEVMQRAYGRSKQPEDYPLAKISEILGFDDVQEASQFCVHYGLTIHDINLLLKATNLIKPAKPYPTKPTEYILQQKQPVARKHAVQASIGSADSKLERPQVSTPISSRPVNLRDHAPAAVKLANWANASPSTRGGALPAYQNLSAFGANPPKSPQRVRDSSPIQTYPPSFPPPTFFPAPSAGQVGLTQTSQFDSTARGLGMQEDFNQAKAIQDQLQKQQEDRQKQEEYQRLQQHIQEKEREKERLLQKEKDRLAELERQREAERLLALERHRLQELERERLYKAEQERMREERERVIREKELLEMEKKKAIELERQRLIELERQRLLELERQRLLELERQRLLIEREKERARRARLDRARSHLLFLKWATLAQLHRRKRLSALILKDFGAIRTKSTHQAITSLLGAAPRPISEVATALGVAETAIAIRDQSWAPLDLPALIFPGLSQKNPIATTIYWKLLVCSFIHHKRLEEWLICKFKRGEVPAMPKFPHTLSLYEAREFCFGIEDADELVADKPLQICVSFVQGAPTADDCRGASAVLMVTDSATNVIAEQIKELTSLANGPIAVLASCPSIGVTLHDYKQAISSSLQKIAHCYYVDLLTTSWEHTLVKSIKWLSVASKQQPYLIKVPLRDYVEKRLEMGVGVLLDAYCNTFSKCDSLECIITPQQILDEYNKIISSVEEDVVSTTNTEVEWPIPEFTILEEAESIPLTWNSKHTVDGVRSILHLLHLSVLPPKLRGVVATKVYRVGSSSLGAGFPQPQAVLDTLYEGILQTIDVAARKIPHGDEFDISTVASCISHLLVAHLNDSAIGRAYTTTTDTYTQEYLSFQVYANDTQVLQPEAFEMENRKRKSSSQPVVPKKHKTQTGMAAEDLFLQVLHQEKLSYQHLDTLLWNFEHGSLL